MKRIRQLGLGFALGSVLLVSGQLAAQTGPQITDVQITDVVTTDVPLDPTNTATNGYKNSAVQRAAARTTRFVNRELSRGRLSIGKQAVSPRVQQNLADILRMHKPPTQVVDRFANSISNHGGDSQLSGKLVNSLKGIFANDAVNGQRLVDAANAYNDVIKAGSSDFVSNPPEEIKVIRAVLGTLIQSVKAAPQGAKP